MTALIFNAKKPPFPSIRPILASLCVLLAVCGSETAVAEECTIAGVDPQDSVPLGKVTPKEHCQVRYRNGLAAPDPDCSPGAINPTVTIDVLRNPDFRTRCLRDKASTSRAKQVLYARYQIVKPEYNRGGAQLCELDHVVSLELGGADTLDNIFPQCGNGDFPLQQRDFRRKDMVENYLNWAVRNGRMSLRDAQLGIARDWTQYLRDAEATCSTGHCPHEVSSLDRD